MSGWIVFVDTGTIFDTAMTKYNDGEDVAYVKIPLENDAMQGALKAMQQHKEFKYYKKLPPQELQIMTNTEYESIDQYLRDDNRHIFPARLSLHSEVFSKDGKKRLISIEKPSPHAKDDAYAIAVAPIGGDVDPKASFTNTWRNEFNEEILVERLLEYNVVGVNVTARTPRIDEYKYIEQACCDCNVKLKTTVHIEAYRPPSSELVNGTLEVDAQSSLETFKCVKAARSIQTSLKNCTLRTDDPNPNKIVRGVTLEINKNESGLITSTYKQNGKVVRGPFDGFRVIIPKPGMNIEVPIDGRINTFTHKLMKLQMDGRTNIFVV